MKRNYFIISFILCVLFSCARKSFVSQGSIEHYFVAVGPGGGNVAYDTVGKSRIWFLDSMLIYETVTTYSHFNDSIELIPRKYTFIDLRTNLAQDYWNFRDTAKPYCSFRFDSTFIYPKFIRRHSLYQSDVRSNAISDTIENGERVKRVKVETDSSGLYTVFYLRPSKRHTILTIDPFVDKQYFPSTIYKFRQFSEKIGGYMEAGYVLVDHVLSKKVLSIFKAWSNNASTNSLQIGNSNRQASPCPSEFHRALDHRSL